MFKSSDYSKVIVINLKNWKVLYYKHQFQWHKRYIFNRHTIERKKNLYISKERNIFE